MSGIACFAQKNYRFESITVDDGLSQSSVICMVQDKLGFLWIGTQDGLNKYDGYSFEVFRHKVGDSTSLPKNFITNLFIDRDNNLWVSTIGYISKYNIATGAFTNYELDTSGFTDSRAKLDGLPSIRTRIFHCRDGSLAVSTADGLSFFNPATGKFSFQEEFKSLKDVKDYFETKNNGDWIFAEKSFHKPQGQSQWKVQDENGLPFYDESNDQLFLDIKGIKKFNTRSNAWEEFIKSSGTLLMHANGDFWVCRYDGFSVHDSSGRWQQEIPIHAIVPGSDATYFNCIYQTRDGVVWVGTNGYGLKKYNPQTNLFGHVSASPNSALHLSHAYVDAIYTTNDTTLYVSTPTGLDIINLIKNTVQFVSSPARILRMTKDEKGMLWCHARDGLYVLRRNQLSKEIHWEDFKNVDLKPNHVDINWANETLKKVGPQFKSLFPRCFLNGDSLWVNHSGIGTYIKWLDLTIVDINTGKILHRFKDDPTNATNVPSDHAVKIVIQDSRKNIWIGSNGEGLCLYNPKTKDLTHFTEKDGLPNNVVYGILEDDNQNLWLSTNKGLCEFNQATKKVRNFDVYDGLQSNEFNTGAYFKSASGKMYFGGVNGLTYFHPEDIVTTRSTPQSALAGFYVNNILLKDYSGYVSLNDEGQILTLQYDERDFGFDVVGIGFSLPGRTHYRYILENYDNEWHDVGNLRHVNFTNIPPGKYAFRVQSSDSFGNWETKGVSVSVLIKAPFWTNKWVWAASGLSIIGLFVFGYYFRVNQLTRETKKLENLVNERTQKIKLQKSQIEAQNEELLTQATYLEEKNTELEKAKGLLEIEVKYLHQHQLLKSSIQTQEVERKRIAQDLHDELGAVLSISRMHLVQIQNEKATNSAMQSGIQQARMLTEAALATMRRISHELMPPQLENFGLIKTLEAITAQMQEAKKITVNFHASDELLRWTLPTELGLYRICMEMINNTLKHAEATKINIDLKQSSGQLLFSYSDNGKGLPEVVHVGHGFKNIEARANIIGGELAMGNNDHGGFYATVKIVGVS